MVHQNFFIICTVIYALVALIVQGSVPLVQF